MVLRRGRNGAYLACSRHPECPFTLSADVDGNPILPPEETEPCEKCGGVMIIKVGPHGPFLACARYPECRSTRGLRKKAPSHPIPDKVCDKCGSPLAIRTGRRGRFVACTGYPKCRNTRPIQPGDLPEGTGGQELPDDMPPVPAKRREKPPASRPRVSVARPRAGGRKARVGARRRS